jgi:hypothetical protein
VEPRGCVGVDAFGGFGAAGADELRAEQLAGASVGGDPNGDGLRAGVVVLVIVGVGLGGSGGIAGGGRFVFA